MTGAASGAPLPPPSGEPLPSPSSATPKSRKRLVMGGLLVAGVVALVGLAAATGGDNASDSSSSEPGATAQDAASAGDTTSPDASSLPPDDVEASADEGADGTGGGGENAGADADGAGDATETEVGGEAADDVDVESTLEDLQTGTDKLDEADEEDIVILSLPTGEPVAAGDLQPLSATIRGENVYLEGTAPSAEVALAYEQQAVEIWGDRVVVSYSVDSRAPEPSASDVVLEKPVLFEPGSAVIDPDYLPVLDACFEFLAAYPAVSMIVEGHTDDVGSDEYNLGLAQQRADAVVAYYQTLGLEQERLVTQAAGESEPLSDNSTEAGRQDNRRIDLSLIGALNQQAEDEADDDAATDE